MHIRTGILITAFAAAVFALSAIVSAQTDISNKKKIQSKDSFDKTLAIDTAATNFMPPSQSLENSQHPTMLKHRTVIHDGWEFEFTPYVFATGIRGTVGARGRTLDVDSSFFDTIKNVKGLLMGKFDVRKGRFVSTNDLMWIKLSADAENPGRLYNTTDLGVNYFMFDPEIGYRFYESGKGSLDILGGVRIWSVETNLRTTSGILQGFDVSQRKSWAAPIVGVRGRTNLSQKFFMDGKFDIGGFGAGADLTMQVYAGGGYSFTKHFDLVGGFRWLQVDYDDSAGFLYETHMLGLQFGAKFNF
jgi:hypothetical protein